MKAKVVILSDSKGWHEKQLRQVLDQRGAEVLTVSLLDCAFAPNHKTGKINVCGLGDTLPDAAIVRGIAAGSFEQ
ncbi:MAG: RimK family alpha-L-glutamate ligase, partial [Gammaproteobacteria bacterium]|nr:RimK family alpha-L-glutamate ligase [Gammaproteobacteria bacterium]